jgi:small subunit ribosomal protein S1
VVEGKVAAVLPFGIFVTLPNQVEGLVHISEISWEKVEDPSTLYKIDDQVKAKVISVDESTGRVNLSIKQLEQDPFSDKVKDIKPDDVVKGTVAKVRTGSN